MNDFQQLVDSFGSLVRLVGKEFTSIWLPIQLGLIFVAFVISAALGALLRRRIDTVSLAVGWPAVLRRLLREIVDNFGAIIFLLLIASMRVAMEAMTLPQRSYLLAVAAKLTAAWVLITLLAGLIRNKFVYRLVAISAWTIAALSILGLLEPVSAALDSFGIVLGGLRITPLLALKTSMLLLITLWGAIVVSDFLDRRMQSAADLTPSIQVLIGKLIRFFLIALAITVVVSSVGIDLSALALFSGAVGVGLGFGLQKIVSNLVSGIILLADKSIKPGDVISVGDSFGWVVTMGARYISVNTRDGREILIPNEDLVTQQVVNWSYSNEQVRLEVRFGVDYGSDPHVVRRLAMETAANIPRVQKDPEPICHLVAFGDSSLDFSLRIWISDPTEGLSNVRGATMLALWDAFKREGIEIPFPQRDLHVREPVRIVVDGGKKS